MKKVLFAAYSMEIGGIETALISLIKSIANEYEITLVLEKVEGEFLKDLPDNVKIVHYPVSDYKIPFIRKIKNKLNQKKFKRKYENKFDFAAAYATYSRPCSFIARTASKNNAIWVHNDYMSFFNNDLEEYKKFFNKLHIDDFKHIIFVSDASKQEFEKYFFWLNDRCVLCNNLINHNRITDLAKEKVDDLLPKSDKKYKIRRGKKVLELEEKIFVNVSRHEEKQKRLSRIFTASKRLFNEGYMFKVEFIGNGPDTEEYIKQAQGNERFVFRGALDNPFPYMKNASALLMTSEFEGYPVVFVEAKVLGLPIITTDVSDAKIDIDKKYGIVEECSDEGVYRMMKKFLEEDKEYEKFDYIKFNTDIVKKIRKIIEDV